MSPAELAHFAVVIPAYNEAATLRDVANRALLQLSRVIVVDDGSTDGSAQVLEGLPVTLLSHAQNLGKAASLWDGMQHALEAGAEAVITLDGDGQHEPEDIARLIEAFQQHPQAIIIGARLHDWQKIPIARYCANRFANFWIAWAAGCPIADSQSGFRVYPAELLRALNIAHGKSAGFVFESEILIEAGRRGVASVAVPVRAIYSSHARPSHFHEVVDIARITRMVAWKLLARGLFLPGLWRSLRRGSPGR
ncbi:MAG: glycosyltransferase family 2 protein [Burkholderiales bacterium]